MRSCPVVCKNHWNKLWTRKCMKLEKTSVLRTWRSINFLQKDFLKKQKCEPIGTNIFLSEIGTQSLIYFRHQVFFLEKSWSSMVFRGRFSTNMIRSLNMIVIQRKPFTVNFVFMTSWFNDWHSYWFYMAQNFQVQSSKVN